MSALKALDGFLGKWAAKLPNASVQFRTSAARWLPIAIIVVNALSLFFWFLAVILVAALGALTMGLGGKPTPFIGFLGPVLLVLIPVACIVGIASGVMMRRRQPMGWYLALLAAVVSTVISVLDLRIFSVIIDLFWIWLLYQVRDYFVEGAPIDRPAYDTPASPSLPQSAATPAAPSPAPDGDGRVTKRRPRKAARKARRPRARRAKRGES